MNKNILGAPFNLELLNKHKEEENEEEYSKNNNKLTNIKFIPIEFDYANYKTGESQVNDALNHGYAVIDNFKTESGVVMVMGLYRSNAY